MNINEAKKYIKNTAQMYLKKDELGDYRIPVERQRPVFLVGPPGIGKTAIVEQIAEELGIALVSYSMTHHTRQSALGLPVIKHKSFDGMEYDVSEYTMSEIIASVYDTMEISGIREGILFLDEINCVSETLAPSMLQFLQYKTFGKHKVPDGWVIVTAGNPPEYNKSVRELDVVTLDRLKVLKVEADFDAFKQYAINRGIHSVILNFLENKKDYFYLMQTTPKGRSYVTARGWEDLSDIIKMYEESGLTVDAELIGQYITNENVIREFWAYYDLFLKYRRDYRPEEILNGNVTEGILTKAGNAPFDERVALIRILLDDVLAMMGENLCDSDCVRGVMPDLRALKESEDVYGDLGRMIQIKRDRLSGLVNAKTLSDDNKKVQKKTIAFLEELKGTISRGQNEKNNDTDDIQTDNQFAYIKQAFDEKVNTLREKSDVTNHMLHNLFEFVNQAFGKDKEMVVLTTELTASITGARFVAMFNSEDYTNYSKTLLVSERQNQIKTKIIDMGLV